MEILTSDITNCELKSSRASMHVIIVNNNQIKSIENIVNDLIKQNSIFDLTIFDNKSTEIETNTVYNKITKKWKSWVGAINIIKSKNNLSLTSIWNWFVENVTNAYVCFLDNDINVFSNFVSHSIKILNSAENIGAITYETNNPNYTTPIDNIKYRTTSNNLHKWAFCIKRTLFKHNDTENFSEINDYIFNEMGYKCAVCQSSPIINYKTTTEKTQNVKKKEVPNNNKSLFVDRIVNEKINCSNAPLHIFIVNFNQIQFTKDVVYDLMNQKNAKFDLTIFDQNSNEEGTKETYSKIKSDWKLTEKLNIIINDCNAPLNHVWNWFIESVSNDYVCLLNNDTRVLNNFAEHTIKILDSNKDCGLVTYATNSIKYTAPSKDVSFDKMSNERQGWAFTIKRNVYKHIDDRILFTSGDNFIYATVYQKKLKCLVCTSSPILHYCSSTIFMNDFVRREVKRISANDRKIFTSINSTNLLLNPNNKWSTEKPSKEFSAKFKTNFTTKKVIKNSNSKKILYTAIVGKYDYLREPIIVSDGWRYICFTDQPFESSTWEIMPIPKELSDLSDVKKQRMLKIQPNRYIPDYEECIWVDGNFTIKCDLNAFVDKECKGDFCTVRHTARNCAYDECDACLKYKKDTKENIEAIRKKLEADKFPRNIGLGETGLIYRRNTENTNKICDEWGYQMLINGTHRDQLTFNYSVWKVNGDIYYFPKDIVRNNKLFSLTRHSCPNTIKAAVKASPAKVTPRPVPDSRKQPDKIVKTAIKAVSGTQRKNISFYK